MVGELSLEEIEQMLKSNNIGRIGCNNGDITYVVPVSYIYENNSVLSHSKDGLKISIMRSNPKVCFELDEIKDFNHWKSVIGWGYYEEITDEKEIETSQQHFSDSLLQFKSGETTLPPHSQRERPHNVKPDYVPTIFYRIRLEQVSGRFEQGL
jgi:uncharacterized protein